MLKKIKVVIFTIILAIPFLSLFVKAQDTSQTIWGPCVHLSDAQSCDNYPTGECYWDYANERCESCFQSLDLQASLSDHERCANFYNSQDRCFSYDYPTCINYPSTCIWNFDNDRCENRH